MGAKIKVRVGSAGMAILGILYLIFLMPSDLRKSFVRQLTR